LKREKKNELINELKKENQKTTVVAQIEQDFWMKTKNIF